MEEEDTALAVLRLNNAQKLQVIGQKMVSTLPTISGTRSLLS